MREFFPHFLYKNRSKKLIISIDKRFCMIERVKFINSEILKLPSIHLMK